MRIGSAYTCYSAIVVNTNCDLFSPGLKSENTENKNSSHQLHTTLLNSMFIFTSFQVCVLLVAGDRFSVLVMYLIHIFVAERKVYANSMLKSRRK